MTVLIHAAAGGVGRLLCQWASALGATVIGTVGSEAKAAVARAAGAAPRDPLPRAGRRRGGAARLTDGRGVDVAYDSVGADTFDGSLDALAPLGHLVNFGQSSGPPAPLRHGAPRGPLADRHAGPIVFHYLADPRAARARWRAAAFDALADGTLHRRDRPRAAARATPPRRTPCSSRATRAGPLVLVPEAADA